MDFIQVDIIGLSTSPSNGGAYALVLGELHGSRRLPIIIGASEAQAIALELEKIEPPRPMTHDLLRDIFDAVSANILEVVIDDLKDGTFFAKIRFEHKGDEHDLDSRPSDAVALAVRANVPIFVLAAVLDDAGISSEDEERDAIDPEDDLPFPEPKPAAKRPAKPKSDLEHLNDLLQKAIEAEEYERAAKIRDEIDRMTGNSN
jgi:bifunctional DNase/RNase